MLFCYLLFLALPEVPSIGSLKSFSSKSKKTNFSSLTQLLVFSSSQLQASLAASLQETSVFLSSALPFGSPNGDGRLVISSLVIYEWYVK